VLQPLLQVELELKRGLYRERPKLRLSTQCSTAYNWLPRALQALASEHPEVELVLQSDVAGSADERLKEDRSDVVLCVIPPSRGKWVQVPLFEDELVLAVPRGHALARRKFVQGSDLVDETLIQHNVSPLERERVVKVLFGEHVTVKHVLRLPVTEAVL